jgi:hypothetical protein
MSKYLIYENSEVKGFCDSKDEAKKAMNNLSKAILKAMNEKWKGTYNIFTSVVDDEIRISKQYLGYIMDGGVYLDTVIKMKEVKKYEFVNEVQR